MALIGQITLDELNILEVSDDPSVPGHGIIAPIGSIALLNDATSGKMWQKVGLVDTDWLRLNPSRKSGYVNPGDFTGSPQRSTVAFSYLFPSTAYVVFINGSNDVRSWTYEDIAFGGFTINSNASHPITGVVSWTAELIEETS